MSPFFPHLHQPKKGDCDRGGPEHLSDLDLAFDEILIYLYVSSRILKLVINLVLNYF